LSALITAACENTPLASEYKGDVAIYIADPLSEQPRAFPEAIRRLYGLTSTEAKLAARLIEGMDIPEAADLLGVTYQTAREYTKRIYDKTGARRQSDLAQLLLRCAAQAAPFED
jgi:DNA-binding CsgD family transcriptional regulator